MQLGYKVVRKLEGKYVSCRVHYKRRQSLYAHWCHVYGRHKITSAWGNPLLVFKNLANAKAFANNEGGRDCTVGNETEEIFQCAYEPAARFIPHDMRITKRDWPIGTDFASEVILLRKIASKP